MMKKSSTVAIQICLIFLVPVCAVNEEDYSEEAGREFLEKLNNEMSLRNTEMVHASWDYESNLTDANLQKQLAISAKLADFEKEKWNEVIRFPWQTFKDANLRRQFKKYSFLGTAALPAAKFEKLEKVVKDMQAVYGKAKICDYYNSSKCDLELEPEITELMAKSRNAGELKHLWTEWRKASGKPVKRMFSEYVALTNEAARLNNFTDASESWLKDYESDKFVEDVERLWQQVRPLYVQLHAYVRRRLREVYGEDVVSKTGPLPAHLLGNVWAQTWSNILNDTVPYPDKPSLNVDSEMKEQGYTPLKMFQVAEEFFTSVGLKKMPPLFWKNSIIEKPKDGRDLICHASAWDFYDGKDFRIKQCTRVNKEELRVIHHEMGHVQYFLQYKDQPLKFKEGANPGFHEAVGDVIALSVSTPKHLQKIGLLKEVGEDEEAEINQLYSMALDKVAFLPFAYLMEQWRWKVFQGKITENDYNSKWWELREQYQGMQPPVMRSDDDFDPGAKYHIVASVPYIRYFVSFIIQFQFHRALCIAAGEFDPENPSLKPLHKCDIYQNKDAGALLGKMLSMGASKPWPEAMKAITGQKEMDASALLEYFSTLQTWLERENAKTGEYIGWEPLSTCSEDPSKTGMGQVHDTFQDDNFAYSYAELVPQNDNSFDSADYHEKLQPWLHAIMRRSTENQFEVNQLINRKANKKPLTYALDRLAQISAQQEERASKKHDRKKSPSAKDQQPNTVEEALALRDKAKEKETGNQITAENEEVADPALKEKETELGSENLRKDSEGKMPSKLSKLLTSLSSSMSKNQNPAVAMPPQVVKLQHDLYNPAEKVEPQEDVMWNAEIVRVQAENMLQSYKVPEPSVDLNLYPSNRSPGNQVSDMLRANQLADIMRDNQASAGIGDAAAVNQLSGLNSQNPIVGLLRDSNVQQPGGVLQDTASVNMLGGISREASQVAGNLGDGSTMNKMASIMREAPVGNQLTDKASLTKDKAFYRLEPAVANTPAAKTELVSWYVPPNSNAKNRGSAYGTTQTYAYNKMDKVSWVVPPATGTLAAVTLAHSVTDMPFMGMQSTPKSHFQYEGNMLEPPSAEQTFNSPDAPPSALRKPPVKKSYIHYHYNLRTPVYYNTIVIQKPKVSGWSEEDTPKDRIYGHGAEPSLSDAMMSLQSYSNNPANKLNDKWKSIKLVPVDRSKIGNQLRDEAEKRNIGENAGRRYFNDDGTRSGFLDPRSLTMKSRKRETEKNPSDNIKYSLQM